MEHSDSSLQRAIADAARLTAPGVIGFYTHIEVTEIFAIRDGEAKALNVFSILVAEEKT
jgi:hypothetical protein